jgi:uncharacterized integral membrane protein
MAEDTPVWEPTTEQSEDRADDAPSGLSQPPSPAFGPGPEPDGLLSRVRWGLITFIVLSTIVIVLAAQNTQYVVVRALGWEAEAPLVVIILITVLLTVILDELVGVIIRRRRRTQRAERAELRRLRNQRKS